MTNRRRCGVLIQKDEPFVLTGFYPGALKRYFNWDFYSLNYYGDCFHKQCYDEAIRAG
jgi:hypothetical protein